MAAAEVPFPLEHLPERLWPLLDPDGNPARRMLLARAALPLPPEELVPAVAFLCNDPDPEVATTARKSVLELPQGAMQTVLSSSNTHAGALDSLARRLMGNEEFVQRIALNRSVHDMTLLHLAEKGQGVVLDIIGQNQVRLSTCPELVKALYFNPRTKMATVSRVLEYAVREELPVQDMPGYKEIVASVMGDVRTAGAAEAVPAPQPEPVPEPPPEPPPAAKPAPWQDAPAEAEPAHVDTFDAPPQPEPAPPPPAMDLAAGDMEFASDLLGAMDMEIIEDDVDGFGDFGGGGGFSDEVEDESFEQLLLSCLEGAEEEEEEESRALYDKVKKMSIGEKIRFGLMGNLAVRELLIKDSNKLVAMSVLRNPGLGDKEIAKVASSRIVIEDVIRTIAESREWCKNYGVKLSLVQNPKCPPHIAMNFLKFLRAKDLKTLSTSKDVPTVIARTAKRLATAKSPGG